ncbi:LacI family DNA-binding transcriptional regulator [Paramicrobacterium fandaimingii]|uniref:LacI family DNA-binding transcriptional regulator n=1 Tax=Paramicrobacterium fandaimingii TaxID=2708079 RepID=UPI001FD1E465|nr:LacI family DNA-binding transcriptional regulator [Microbacterium fandaimingii]
MARRSPERLTISDVAAKAGVSLSTVSRVMNGSTKVDPELTERVREAAIALGYTASPLARSLVLGKTQTVSVIVPDLGNPTFQGALRGLSSGATGANYHVLVADSFEDPTKEAELAIEARRRSDGIVLCAPRMSDDELNALLPQIAPAVVINRTPTAASVPVVAADYRSGFSQLLTHLNGLGHQKMLFLGGAEGSASNRDRLAAIDEFCANHPDTTIDVLSGYVTFAEGYASVDAVISSTATGVLAFNDLVAMGLLSALSERGVGVPGDLSITGFDDIEFAQYTTPPLTTAAVPSPELGTQAWARMWDLLNDRQPAYNLSFGPLVVPRGTTGPAS